MAATQKRLIKDLSHSNFTFKNIPTASGWTLFGVNQGVDKPCKLLELTSYPKSQPITPEGDYKKMSYQYFEPAMPMWCANKFWAHPKFMLFFQECFHKSWEYYICAHFLTHSITFTWCNEVTLTWKPTLYQTLFTCLPFDLFKGYRGPVNCSKAVLHGVLPPLVR